MKDTEISKLKHLQQSYGVRYRYSVTNFIELVSHLEDQPFKRVQSWFHRIYLLCDPAILPSPEMAFLTRAGLDHYIDPVWIPNLDQTALKVERSAKANSLAELTGVINISHYPNLREVDGNSMIAIMEELQEFKRPITPVDHGRLLEWFTMLAGFFLFVRPTNSKIALNNLPSEERNRFGMALKGGVGKLFMTHCMKLVMKTVNDGRKVCPNDLYDMLQLILLEDDNILFLTEEKTFFQYPTDADEPQRVLRWKDFISCV